MSEESRSLIAYEYWRDSAQRFDYFVTGLIGAIVAYIAQSYVPQKLGITPNTLELIALLTLLSSLICAFKRIEASVMAFRMMSRRLSALESYGKITEAQSKSPFFREMKTGKVYDAETAEQTKLEHQATADEAHEAGEKLSNRSQSLYSWRNGLLLTGFILLLVSKVLSAYCAGS